MEKVEGLNLFDVVSNTPPSNLIHEIFYQLGLSILELHSIGVAHNDLKLDNVMVNVREAPFISEIKIIDLGMSTEIGGTPYPHIGKRKILSFPHLDPRLSNGGKASPSTDIYSFGIMLLQLATLKNCEVYARIGELFRLQTHLPRNFADMIEQLQEQYCVACWRNKRYNKQYSNIYDGHDRFYEPYQRQCESDYGPSTEYSSQYVSDSCHYCVDAGYHYRYTKCPYFDTSYYYY